MLEANLLGNGDGRAVVKPLHLHLASMRGKKSTKLKSH
jgi:hypothetical protein